MYRTAVKIFCLSVTLCITQYSTAQTVTSGDEIIARAKRIHDTIITLDTHVDFEPTLATPECNPGTRLVNQKVDLVKMNEGGLDGVFFAVWVPQKPLTFDWYTWAYEQAVQKFDAIFRMCTALNREMVELATSPDDVLRIKKKGKRIALIGVENGFPIGENLENLRYFYEIGARYMTITHMGYNQLGDSSDRLRDIPAGNYGGLSEFGKEVIQEMNRLGMMVDVSHISCESFNDVIKISKAPVIASHSGCRALCDVPRNLDDDQLRALGKNGGTVQIVGYAGYLKRPAKEATIKDFVDHIDYAVKLIGIDHVGIGSDFDGGGGVPGYNDVSECMNVTVELLRIGYSDKDIEKIWGSNLLRVWRDVEQIAHEIQEKQ